MKKILTISAVIIVAAVVFGIAGFAYAQTQTPPSDIPFFGPGRMGGANRPEGFGPGMMRWSGAGRNSLGMMGGWGNNGTYGPMHTEMVNAFAAALGMDPDDLQAQLDAGETMWTIAEASGLSAEEFAKLMVDARTQALEAAVAAGSITQEQADWMAQRMSQRQANGYGPGNCPMHGNAGPAGRPAEPTTNP